ncbi:MAG: hypothetical protein KAT65_23780 [Methanophagales archaeon]|nr:hypothetical protein [Methanophagales archaeon]
MNKKQWHLLAWTFLIMWSMTMVVGPIATAFFGVPLSTIAPFMYFGVLCFILAIASEICGWLEKEKGR